MLAWRNWQTRTAQDRVGQPVEVRILSRAPSQGKGWSWGNGLILFFFILILISSQKAEG
jgi:hypothetical protein